MWAVLPIKPFQLAKRRLARILSNEERANLARVMCEDVLNAVCQAKSFTGVAVVTSDSDAANMATSRGLTVLTEMEPTSINSAVKMAAKSVGSNGMVVIPSDVPHISSAEINSVVSLLEIRSVVLVPAKADQGTNILGCNPANLIDPCFGEDSFNRHIQASKDTGVNPTTLYLPHLMVDLDRVEDLAEFVSWKTETKTNAFLSSLKIAARLSSSLSGRHNYPGSIHDSPIFQN